MPRDFEIGDDFAGARLETFLRKGLGLGRPLALKALRKGWIRVDGRRARGDRRLEAGEVVRVTNYGLPLPEGEARNLHVSKELEQEAAASVRHVDEDLIVSAKPSGRVVHRGTGQDQGWIDALGAACPGPTPVPVGRLDRDTSGLLALARGRFAARELFAALRRGDIQRTYVALVAGEVVADQGTVDRPLKKEGAAGREQMHVSAGGQPARTHFRVLERLRGSTLLHVELETGRTHQIRAHLDSTGHPVLGDPRYGSSRARALASERGLERLFLHAATLRLPHPRTGQPLAFDEPLPADLAQVAAGLR